MCRPFYGAPSALRAPARVALRRACLVACSAKKNSAEALFL
uniref:Uncharacterized protein n=1 Tax=Curvibacter symbiont subsp. Hydra magnipapillata TaxID=667019 RepID=C9YGF0_CURXX|nr:hypothetical protein Csp_B18500 [Curvibacter putative symbiont of Hydra magnipapillata]